MSIPEIDNLGPRATMNEGERQRQFWFLDAQQYQQLEDDFALLETPANERVKAKRFDFVFNNTYYVLNAKVVQN